MKQNRDSYALRHVKKIMSHKNQYKHGKCNSNVIMILSLAAFAIGILNGIITSQGVLKGIWFLFAGVQFATFAKHLMIKGFIEYIDGQKQ